MAVRHRSWCGIVLGTAERKNAACFTDAWVSYIDLLMTFIILQLYSIIIRLAIGI